MIRVLSVSILLLVSCVFSGTNCQAVGRVKRSDIDLQTCIDNFNVHKDKIIRTQDSQNMGAKYLNEIDLGSREECLRLCCETEDCDVFVFEEKNSGSCYLFHCGPPEDFKCKFTHHVNYSSAVLSINRHLPDLESQIKLTKHEQDLTKLRKPEGESDILRMVPVVPEMPKITSTSTMTPAITKEIIPMLTKVEKHDEERKCSRNQFECRSTGECIAIYNACDGIPQCADASDEAIELGCPAMEAVAAPTPATTPPRKTVAPLMQQQGQTHRETQQVQAGYASGNADISQPKSNPQNTGRIHSVYQGPQQIPQNQEIAQILQGQVQLPSEADFLRPMVADSLNGGRGQYAPVQSIQPYLMVQGQTGWIPRQPQMGSPVVQQMQVPLYPEKNNRLFEHKDTGIQVPEVREMTQLQYPEAINRDYTKLSNYYGENYRQPIQQDNWPIENPRYPNHPSYSDNSELAPSEKIGVNPLPPYKAPVTIVQEKSKDKLLETGPNTQLAEEQLAHDLMHSKDKDNMERATSVSKLPKSKSKSDIPQHHHEQFPDVISVKLADTEDTEDGASYIPKGAILSLTLGLIITSVMAVLIGCRLRVVRRRMKRGGKSYAHDADFLVNGMYL